MPEIVTEKLRNGNTIEYKIINGTAYHVDTPDEVVRVLESARASRRRIRIFFGDSETGRDWLEEHDTMGYVGRSTGTIKIPILVHNERSWGGGAILDHCIVMITIDGHIRYRHPSYHQGKFEININTSENPEYIEEVRVDGKVHARFKKVGQAERWVRFIQGVSNRK